MQSFCRFFKNGLAYNNDTSQITAAPCCYFDRVYPVDQKIDRTPWLDVDTDTACRVCLNQEASGQHSYRESSFEQTTGLTDQVEFLTVAVNKRCNLACPMCDAGSSSFWYQENERNGVEQPTRIHALHQEDRAGITTDRFIQLLSEIDLSKLTYIKFGGGEPLMSDTHEQIMRLVPNPENVTVHYTTNFSIMPTARTFDLWRKFKLIKWVASLDGVQDQFEYLRWPYRWHRLEAFVPDAIAQAPDNVMFGVEHTLTPLNVLYYDQFETWFKATMQKNRFGDASDLNLHPCFGILGLDKTPPRVRAMVEQRYGADHTVTRMLAEHPYVDNTTELVAYLDSLDQQRNTAWRQVFSEVEGFFHV